MSLPVASVLFASALAGPAQDIAAEFLADGPPPAMGLSCAPVREAVRFAEALGSFSGGVDRPELQMLLDAARDASVQTVDGIDVGGGFTMVAGTGGATVVLPVRGDITQALPLFLTDGEDVAAWTLDGDTAHITDPDGTRRSVSVNGEHARLTVVPEVVLPASGQSVPPGLLHLPDAPGCAMWLQPPQGKSNTPAVLRNPVALWLPFEDGAPMQLNLQLPSHRDRATAPKLAAPLDVSGPVRPQAVITLGVPPLAILRDPVVQDSIPAAIRAQLPDASVADAVGAGMVVGTFFGPEGPSLVAVVPFETPRGRPVSARRIWKVAADGVAQAQQGRGGPPPVRVGRRSLQVQVSPKIVLTLHAAKGRLYAGNVRSQVDAVAQGEGEPWLDARERDWAATHAFSVFGELPLPGLGEPLGVTVGAGTQGDVLRVQLNLDPGLRDPRVAAALRALSSARRRGAMPSVQLPRPVEDGE